MINFEQILQARDMLVSKSSNGNWQSLDNYMEPTGNPWVDIIKSKTWSLFDQRISGLAEVPADGDYGAFLDAYAAIPWLYIGSWLISSSISGLPLLIYEGKGSKAELVEEGPAFELLQAPNQFEAMSTLMEYSVLNLELTGNGYWEKGEAYKNLPSNLFGLEASNITIEPDPEEKIGGYVYTGTGGTKQKYEPEEIVHFKYANPTNQFYGQGVVKVLQTTLVTELMRELYNKNFFENEARPDIILKQTPDMQKGIPPVFQEGMKETAAKWRAAFGGARNTRLPVVLPAGMDISLLTESNQDMHYREFEKSLRERVLGTMGVPPALVGLFEYANYASSKEQLKIFWTVTVPPKCRMIAANITRSILKPFNNNLWCHV